MNAATAGPASPWQRWKPGVPRAVLLLAAGVMWGCVGTMLDSLAGGWLLRETRITALVALALGLAAALVIHHFGFLRIVDRNLARILPMEGKHCLFAFMPAKSYLLIAVMMTTGLLLRHSALPKRYLAVLYVAIGTALVLSSVRYFRFLLREMRTQPEA
jgi:hypothetical protein